MDFLLELPEGTQPCRHHDFRHLASRMVRENIYVILSYPLCGNLLQQLQETNTPCQSNRPLKLISVQTVGRKIPIKDNRQLIFIQCLLCSWHTLTHLIFIVTLGNRYYYNYPILQIRKLKHSEIKLVQGHTAMKQQSWDLSPGGASSRVYALEHFALQQLLHGKIISHMGICLHQRFSLLVPTNEEEAH